jgi:hypothetical protein
MARIEARVAPAAMSWEVSVMQLPRPCLALRSSCIVLSIMNKGAFCASVVARELQLDASDPVVIASPGHTPLGRFQRL